VTAQEAFSMHDQHLGRSGLKVSRLALGTMNFGELTDESTSFCILDEALNAGINFFDTADVYGGSQSPDMKKGFGPLRGDHWAVARAGRTP
jgi:aryl-alcohol dehydrogenase-like predicted oxidoreductase